MKNENVFAFADQFKTLSDEELQNVVGGRGFWAGVAVASIGRVPNSGLGDAIYSYYKGFFDNL